MSSPAVTNTSRHATCIALLVAITFFMENLDATVIATALPQMASDFGESAVSLNIGISAYLLAVAVFIPLSGWVADRYGPRRVFAGAIGLFTVASLLCGMAPSLETFVGARVLQGIGGALMVPVGRLVVLRTTEKKDLVRMLAVITWPGGASIGPTAWRPDRHALVVALDLLPEHPPRVAGHCGGLATDS